MVRNSAGGIGGVNGNGQRVDEFPVPFFGFANFLFRRDLERNVACDAACVNEFAILEKRTAVDDGVPYGAVLVAQPRRIGTQYLAVDHAAQNVIDYRLIGMELGDIAANVLFTRIANEVEFCPVRPKDSAVDGNRMHSDAG